MSETVAHHNATQLSFVTLGLFLEYIRLSDGLLLFH